jgi:glutaredoxin
MRKLNRWVVVLPLAALGLAGTPAYALYKVVGPDGKVTYTDTPPPPGGAGRISTVSVSRATASSDARLPLELRQTIQRYPVTLYTTKECGPCDNGRALLRERGVPYTEKLVLSHEDGEALQRLSGARATPTLTIGSQVLRGLTADSWHSYLDAAGYPRESRLPSGYQPPVATPLTQPAPARPAVASAPSAPQPADTPAPLPPGPGGIRF